MNIPLFGLKEQYKSLRTELRREVLRVLDSGAYILGPEGRAFEAEFAKAIRVPHVLGVDSGTSALELALLSAGVRRGDEVIVPAFTFIATATAVSAIGAKPVLADVDADSLTLDPKAAEAAGTRRTRAILPVHLFGQPADMSRLMALAKRKGWRVIEDCAQSHLAEWGGRPVGGFGNASAFSFYPTKNLGAAGDAGAVATPDRELAAACGELRNCGRSAGKSYDHSRIGFNCRLDDLQAAVLRVKLKRLGGWVKRRRALAALYDRELAGMPLLLPRLGAGGEKPSFALYVVRTERRDELAKHLEARGIGTGVYYPIPIHLQPAYRSLRHRAGDFPVSERASRTALALPLYPELTDSQARAVSRAVKDFFR